MLILSQENPTFKSTEFFPKKNFIKKKFIFSKKKSTQVIKILSKVLKLIGLPKVPILPDFVRFSNSWIRFFWQTHPIDLLGLTISKKETKKKKWKTFFCWQFFSTLFIIQEIQKMTFGFSTLMAQSFRLIKS